MKSKRQTMSKVTREREVKARRALKLEKKYAAAAERKAKAEGATSPFDGFYGASPVRTEALNAPTDSLAAASLTDEGLAKDDPGLATGLATDGSSGSEAFVRPT